MIDKKLEARIERLEKAMRRKNEQLDNEDIVEAVYQTATEISSLCKALAGLLKSTDEVPWEIDSALSACEEYFPKEWFDQFKRINNNR